MKNLQNSVQLIGRLGADPEVKTFENGKSVANFRLATKETYKNANGEKVSNTQWHNIVAWNATAIFLKDYVSKGDEIALEGRLIHRSYEDKEGQKKYITEIVVNEILPLRQNAKSQKAETANA